MIIYILLGLAVLAGLGLLGFYNGTIRLRNGVQEAFATMDVFLKKRYDLIPNLVETVKAYATHEQEVLVALTEARARAVGARSEEDRFGQEAGLQAALRNLFAVAENYPDLRANENFLAMQRDLGAMEGEIAQSRKYYNAMVRQFNTRIQVFPGNVLAGMFGFTARPMFEVDAPEERANVAVRF